LRKCIRKIHVLRALAYRAAKNTNQANEMRGTIGTKRIAELITGVPLATYVGRMSNPRDRGLTHVSRTYLHPTPGFMHGAYLRQLCLFSRSVKVLHTFYQGSLAIEGSNP
jgi:hypothetical protein